MIRRILYTLAHSLLKDKSINIPREMTENMLGLTPSDVDAQTLLTYAQVCLIEVIPDRYSTVTVETEMTRQNE